MMKSTNENGRSMVEMLGVLAVIGVLSIGGIAGYRMAMKKNIENEITHFLQYLKLAIDTENYQDESVLKTAGTTTEIKESRVEALCTHLPDSFCQEYGSSYFQGNHILWTVSVYSASYSGSTASLPRGSEFITLQIVYGLHHPSFADDADICRNMVNAVAQTFGDQLGGFNYESVARDAEDILKACDEGTGFHPFNIILSLPED